jgi:hypothetical protein
VALTLPIRMSAIILDEQLVQALATVYALVDPAISFASVAALWDTWLADLEACTDGQILRAGIHAFPAMPGGLKTGPVAGSRVEQTGILNFNATGTSHVWGALIPALSNAGTIISGGKIVLTPGSPAATLAALLSPSGGTAILEWTNANNQALSTLRDALISFREYRDQLTRNTLEI